MENYQKEYFVCFDHVHSGLRVLDTLYGHDYILYGPKPHDKIIEAHWENYNQSGTNIQSLVVKIIAEKLESAHIKALARCNEITAFLAGIYQVSFFFTLVHSVFNYQTYDQDPVEYWKNNKIIYPLVNGMNTLYSIGGSKKHSVLIKELLDFEQYRRHEDIFYLWRSAEDLFNELGWRFLNYIRIIELITKKQRGGKQKTKIMYNALPDDAKRIINENDLISIIEKWGNPVAHGNIKDAVIPRIPRDHFNQDPDSIKLSEIVRILIKDKLNTKNHLLTPLSQF